MYGATVSSLNLFMKQAGKPEALMWNLNGSQVQCFALVASKYLFLITYYRMATELIWSRLK